MSARAYYNEIDPFAADWLRNLIAKGLIPAGDVDTRSIADVAADDLVGYAQCHFFAGIGGWALAARLAGWPDERELWTGSCPCQPFSVAGKGAGTNDERHLWPHQLRLIRARRPAVWMGEQVAAAVGKDWLDGVLSDLEGIGYAGRAAVVPACAVDGPHRRDRLWVVAERDGAMGDSQRARLEGHARYGDDTRGRTQQDRPAAEAGCGGAVGHADQLGASEERQQRGRQLGGAGVDSFACAGSALGDADSSPAGRIAGIVLGAQGSAERSLRGEPDGSADADRSGSLGHADGEPESAQQGVCGRPNSLSSGSSEVRDGLLADPDGIACGQGRSLDGGSYPRGGALAWPGSGSGDSGSAWASHAWIIGHDGKARRVGTRLRRLADGLPAGMAGLRAGDDAAQGEVEMIPLLAHGVPARTGKLRAFGNAIVPQLAAEVVGAWMDVRP